ncbi:hypothetical protein NIES4072_31240 [Nostoc commune NIES-4072]|uniref:Uncharacterized protein n=1 Tax=Nostoc commune NIES-4072 TaxID=2005467 RepID=A0A2R5FL01_NOSCO|nr:hypothetical protein [Nostoc commune]BBD69543.1 hypothetical protein NIES4070_59520 [Nostoc commune HK-02]GBG19456.1 hypothetical protein NIES4072_31240 [Nostoc commune NIES-4072]
MTYQETPYQKTNIVDANGNVINSFGGSGTSGDASATNQATQIQLETAIRDRLPAALVNGRLPTDGSGVTQPVSATALPLPNGAATDLTLQQVKAALLAQINLASTVWTDNSGAFYVRRDLINEGTGAITVTFTDPSGNSATPGAGLRPLASVDKDTITDFYDVITGGTGYSVGDLLSRIAVLDVNNTNSPSATFIWLNLTAGTILSSTPTPANIERANENIGSRQVGSWAVTANLGITDAANLSNLSNAIGTPITGAAMPTGGVGWIGWLSAIWKLISDRVPILTVVGDALKITGAVTVSGPTLTSIDNKTPLLGANNAANSTPVTLANDGVFITSFGSTSDTAAASDTAVASFASLFRRLLGQFTSLLLLIGIVRDRLMPPGTLVPYLASNGANLKTSAGSFYAFTCTNANASIRYFQIFNKASVPTTNDVPITYFPVYGNNGFLLIGQDILGGAGIDSTILTNGVAWGISTTAATYTAATASEHSVTVRYS